MKVVNALNEAMPSAEISNICLGLISDQKQEKTGLLGLLKNLLKKNKEDNVVR